MANRDIEVRRDNRPQGSGSAFDLMPEFDDIVEGFFGPRFNSLLGDWPQVSARNLSDITENDKAYILSVEVPGINKDEIDINVSGNLLTIKAEHNEERSIEGEQQGMRRRFRSYSQSFSLPTTVDSDRLEAHYENGVLEVMLPKTEQAQPKKVAVQSGKGSFIGRIMGKKEENKTGQKQTTERANH